MNYLNELQSVAQDVVGSPKVLATVAGATASLGMVGLSDLMRGALSASAILAGIIATILLGRVHWAKYKNERLKNRILRRQLSELGETVGDDE